MYSAIVSGIKVEPGKKPPDLLKALTKPLTSRVVQLDKKVLTGWSLDDPKYANVTTLLKFNCKREVADLPSPFAETAGYHGGGGGGGGGGAEKQYEKYQCDYVLAGWGLSDTWVGLILLAFSLALLCTCLILLVKILNSLMRDKMAFLIKKFLNADVPRAAWLTGYLAILVGMGITFLVQSSSVFTSTLTPLVGTDIISLERAYPLTLGQLSMSPFFWRL